MTTQTSDHSLTFELVNDKAELEAALEELKEVSCCAYHNEGTVKTLLELVPRLMASYEEALQLTHTLADAWESYMNDQTPAGIYVPS